MQRPSSNRQAIIEKRRFLQRYMETAELMGVSLTVEHLLPCLQEIFKQDDGTADKQYTKFIFANMEKLVDFLSSSEITVGYNGIRDHIMSFFYDFFQSDKIDETLKQEIQPDVIDLLVKVSKIMTNEDRTEKILPIILESIRDDSDEEKRILGLELVDKLAEYVGKDNCQNFLMYEIVSLQDDPIYRVRKETISRMINISKILGKEIFLGILFPVFKKLANDQIWGVRRSAVEQLPNISNLCPIEIKNGILIEMFKKFASDSSKWVKLAAFQFLGPFIASYEGIEPNPVLVDYYISMCEQNKSPQPDNEVPYYCAYNFPAVLQTLGPKLWPKLQPVHDLLVKDTRWKVRRTLAYSLHEIAKILGPEVAERELIPVLYSFLKDVDEVKEGVTENLPKFIQILSPEQRETYIDKIAQTQIDAKDWRKRVVQSKQIRKFSKIFSAETVFKFYVPVFFQLCQDQVAEVRIEAAKAIKNICIKLHESQELFDEFISKVVMFKQSNKYNLRQTFIYMCEGQMQTKSQELFTKHLLAPMCDLQRDRIINVRMALAEALNNHFKSNPNGGLVQELRELRLMTRHLKLDSRDVSEILEFVEITMLDGDEQAFEEIKQQPTQQQKQKESNENTSLSVVTEETELTNDTSVINQQTDNGNKAIKQDVTQNNVIQETLVQLEDPYHEQQQSDSQQTQDEEVKQDNSKIVEEVKDDSQTNKPLTEQQDSQQQIDQQQDDQLLSLQKQQHQEILEIYQEEEQKFNKNQDAQSITAQNDIQQINDSTNTGTESNSSNDNDVIQELLHELIAKVIDGKQPE